MTHLAGLAGDTPTLPARRRISRSLAASVALHALVATALALRVSAPIEQMTQSDEGHLTTQVAEPPRIVFLPTIETNPGGGGGGGNRHTEPIRRARGIGSDRMTLRIAKPVVIPDGIPRDAEPHLPGLLLDARPLASGTVEQTGLPEGGVPTGVSTGPGSGGGVGEGVGTGIGPGRGPGLGSGIGGGTGGGVYRAGGGVSAPRLLSQLRPSYTADALDRRITGSVFLEVVVGRDGVPMSLHVVRSLDPGLDEEAIKAVRQWRFVPGLRAGVPVDVLVSIVVDFQIS